VRKFILILAVLVVLCVVNTAEAAYRCAVVPKVVNSTTRSIIKVGEDFFGFFWRNKVAIATSTILVTAATQPQPFIDGAVAVASGPPVLIQHPGVYGVTPRQGGHFFPVALIGVVVLIGMYMYGGQARTAAKIIALALLIGGVIFCCGVARADVSDLGLDATTCTVDRSIWWFIINLILIILLGLPAT